MPHVVTLMDPVAPHLDCTYHMGISQQPQLALPLPHHQEAMVQHRLSHLHASRRPPSVALPPCPQGILDNLDVPIHRTQPRRDQEAETAKNPLLPLHNPRELPFTSSTIAPEGESSCCLDDTLTPYAPTSPTDGSPSPWTSLMA